MDQAQRLISTFTAGMAAEGRPLLQEKPSSRHVREKFRPLNAVAFEYLIASLDDRPGVLRECESAKPGERTYSSENGKHAIALAYASYEAAELTDDDRALALHILARDVLRAGYTVEAVQISIESKMLDKSGVLLADNLRAMGYAVGVVDAQFKPAYAFYKQAEDVQKEKNRWTKDAEVKALMDEGRLYYRAGGLGNYTEAMGFYDRATRILIDVPHDQSHELRFQLNYERAKTLLNMARVNPRSGFAAAWADDASKVINLSTMMVRNLPDSDYERAALKVIEGDLHGLRGNTDKAIALLEEALTEHIELNRTAVPRLFAIEAKISLLKGETSLTSDTMRESMERLVSFYGTTEHPRIPRYISRFMQNEVPAGPVWTPRDLGAVADNDNVTVFPRKKRKTVGVFQPGLSM